MMRRWKEHFDGLLNGDAGNGEETREGMKEVHSEGEEIGLEEVRRAIKKLKNGMAGGVCGIQAEMVKAGGFTMIRW